jgi:hypothetical protein
VAIDSEENEFEYLEEEKQPKLSIKEFFMGIFTRKVVQKELPVPTVQPIYCKNCGTVLVTQDKCKRFDSNTGKPLIVTVKLFCPSSGCKKLYGGWVYEGGIKSPYLTYDDFWERLQHIE